VLHFARLIMAKDPFKHKAPREEGRNFLALFGCRPEIVLELWNRLANGDLIPQNGTMTHLLWTLCFCKTYAKWKTMEKITGHDPKTLRKWIKAFFDNIELLEGDIVSALHAMMFNAGSFMAHIFVVKILWKNRKKGDILNDCLVSVDCVDFRIPFHGRRFHTHKWKFGSGLRYEVAVGILSGDVVWISGPYEPGIWNDISIFRNGLLSMLEEGERIEADDGYRGAAPRYVKCPRSMGHHGGSTEAMQAIVRRRHESVNKRFNQWMILKSIYRGDIRNHGQLFRTVAIITQLAIENGEPLFSVDYEDPDLDNNYFEESDSEEDDNDDDDD
jgi:hypothetical protein